MDVKLEVLTISVSDTGRARAFKGLLRQDVITKAAGR